MHDSKKPPELDTEKQTTQVNFLRSDLALCSTLAELAKTKLRVGDREDAQRILEKADKIYAPIEQLLTHIASTQVRDELTKELKDRRATLDSVKQLL
jgi:hypothetical protein